MKLSPERFNRFIDKMGQDVKWRRAHHCPCRDPRSGAPRYDCTICQNGRIWDPPVCTRLALTGQKMSQQWAKFGLWENGDVVCTLPSDEPIYSLGDYDRVLFHQSTVPFSNVLINDGTPQRLPFVPVSIARVLWVRTPATSVDTSQLTADNTTVTVDGNANDAQTLVNGKIPRIAADGTLTWPNGGGPPTGVNYTVTGRKNPEYFCFMDFPQDRAHHGGLDLPRRVVLRAFELYSKGS